MHDHDLDLIGALAEGSLDDETAARALVESCAECRDEYQGARAAIEFLSAAPQVVMTDIERASLHREVWTSLRAAPVASRSPWWHRWSYVAAGLFVVVGLAGVLNARLGGQDMSATFSEIGSGLGSASEEPPAQLFEQPESAAEDSAGGGESTTTAAASSDTTSVGDSALPLTFAPLAASARERQDSGDLAYQRSAVPDDIEECLTRLGLDDLEVVDDLDLDRRYLALMPEEGDTVTFVAVDDCTVVAVEG